MVSAKLQKLVVLPENDTFGTYPELTCDIRNDSVCISIHNTVRPNSKLRMLLIPASGAEVTNQIENNIYPTELNWLTLPVVTESVT